MASFLTFKLVGIKKAVEKFTKASESTILKEIRAVMSDIFTTEIRTDAISNVKSKLNKTKGSGRGLSQNIDVDVKILGKVVIGSVGVKKMIPYGAIHEYGGITRPRVTAKSRKFFWRKFFKTGESKWKAMALTDKKNFTVKIRKRPYLRPALMKNMPLLKREIKLRLDLLDKLGV